MLQIFCAKLFYEIEAKDRPTDKVDVRISCTVLKSVDKK